MNSPCKQYKLIDLRSKNHLTQEEFAKKIGISRSFYTQIEQGTRTPSTRVLFKIANEFNVGISDFFCPSVSLEATKINK